MKLLRNFFRGFAAINIFVQDTLDADAGAADADVVGGEEGEVVLEVHGLSQGAAASIMAIAIGDDPLGTISAIAGWRCDRHRLHRLH